MISEYCSLFLFCLCTSKALEASGLNVSMENVANTDHFNIIEQLVDGEYHLTKVNHSKMHDRSFDNANAPLFMTLVQLSQCRWNLCWWTDLDKRSSETWHQPLRSHYSWNCHLYYHIFVLKCVFTPSFVASFEDDGKELNWLLHDDSVSPHSSAQSVKHGWQQVCIDVEDRNDCLTEKF